MEKIIPFNKPFLVGNEIEYIKQAVASGKISGNGVFTKKCQNYFETTYGFKKTLLTTSCTDALEMCALLANIQPGDEVIVPGFTFVSTALAFVRQGAKIVFADSQKYNPNIDADEIESLVTSKTKAIVPVHYAGITCDMDKIMDIAQRHNLLVIEDAAQAIDSYYAGKDGSKKALGSIGHLAAFSFHDTKNITCGEGGMLAVNDERFIKRAEVIWEKGTNRAEFFRGGINKYEWVDTGSSFLPSEITAAFLWAQVENMERIQLRRKTIWNNYYNSLKPLEEGGFIRLPLLPEYALNNGHIFYINCNSLEKRSKLIEHLKRNNIQAVFHYLSLHESPYYKTQHDGRVLPNCDYFINTILRLPLYFELQDKEIERITSTISTFYL